MTLDIPKFIENSVRTQSKIHHLDINVKAIKKSDIPDSVIELISKDYGEKYLDDADYVTFFWGGIAKDDIEKLFNTVDKALGKSANKLTDKDFKKIRMDDSDEPISEEPSEDDEDSGDDDANDDEEIDIEATEETSDSSDEEEPEEGEESEEEDEEESDEEESDEDNDEEELDESKLNEDEEENIEIDVEEKPAAPTAYFFLKITTK